MAAAGFLPRPIAPRDAELGWSRLADAVDGSPDLKAWADAVADVPPARRLLDAVFGNSPYLTQSAVIDPAFLRDLLTHGPQATVDRAMADLAALHDDLPTLDRLATRLRVAKRRVALAIAVADIAGLWRLAEVTGALTDLAEAALGLGAARVLADASARGAFELAHPTDPQRGSGLVILGMGKLGGRELNYSSDIDLIVLYDADRVRGADPDAVQGHFVRLTRSLVRLMEERTADGYVFRTDLRLRPDPSSTPVAMSVLAAETYYESLGQNWERAAMIKARPVAGDLEAGARFLHGLRPYVWRKNLDFAAIRDIQAIKRQINAQRGGSVSGVAGHNLKLGRGGIREIEFFVQTQQLIWGGRLPSLRQRATLEGLAALVEASQVTEEVAEGLREAYVFLRWVEHRLQMIDDRQTHSLPKDPGKLDHLAVFLGFGGRGEFAAALLARLRCVERRYAALFEDVDGPPGDDAGGNLVFTGAEDDPDTLETLSDLGFKYPKRLSAMVRKWHHGHYRSTRSTRGRQLLTQLMPALLRAMAQTPDPDDAFARLDAFLSRLPSGVQLFSMFQANPKLLDLLARILGTAPRLAEHLSRNPTLLDNVLTPGFLDQPPGGADLDVELDRLLADVAHYEGRLDATRRWAADRRFQAGIQVLNSLVTPARAAVALTDVAETALRRLGPRVEEEFRLRHGYIPGAGMIILGMGKMGGREMTPTSDLDLIFVYDTPDLEARSNGARPLVVSQYYARLSQRLINAFTVQTGEGTLYDVDMRLRPSGNAGPIASSLEAFDRYQSDSAWTWEHMALTRARPISGPLDLSEKVCRVIRRTLARPRDPDALLREVASMRRRVAAEHGTDSPWEIKHFRGGLVDVEFLVQYLQLRHAADHPSVLSQNTRDALTRLRDAGVLAAATADDLIAAADLWQALQGVLRIAVSGPFHPDARRLGVESTLAKACGVTRFDLLEPRIRAVAAVAHRHFVEVIETPAADLPETS